MSGNRRLAEEPLLPPGEPVDPAVGLTARCGAIDFAKVGFLTGSALTGATGAGRALLAVAVAVGVLASGAGVSRAQADPATWPRASAAPGARGIRFVSSAQCVECHSQQAERWRGSHHDLAMQPASEESVLGDFGDTSFTHKGVTTRFFRRGASFAVRTEGADGELADFEVAYTFGADPLQQYLIAFPGGRLQALAIAWDTERSRWFHLYPDEKIDSDDALHWTGRYQRWNAMCAECHSTNLEKHYDAASDTYRTTWAEVDVGCEACHGPGAEHVVWARERKKRSTAAAGDDGLVVHFGPERSRGEIEACARCHARRRRVSAEDRHGRPFLDDFAPELLRGGLYHSDGQIQGEVYVYGSFLQSAMYQKGVRCSDCHDPHSLTLRASGNALCTRCHSEKPDPRFPTLRRFSYDDPAHHHHAAGGEGARCVSCHMPERTYMVVDPRRDHSFRIPRPDLSLSLGTPSACTACHSDRSASWALQTVTQWPGWKAGKAHRDRHFGSALAAGRSGEHTGAQELARLAEDVAQPGIARATALEMLRAYGPLQPEGRDALFASLEDDDPLVRTAAAALLDVLPAEARAQRGFPRLDDPIRAVRVEAAQGLSTLPVESFTPAQRKRFDSALAEYEASLAAVADLPAAHLNLGVLHTLRGEGQSALRAYETALRLDPRFLPASVNLANLYNGLGQNDDAERVLREAITHSPLEGELHYSLGLLIAEVNRLEEAEAELARAARLLPERARIRYNHALALQQLGRSREAGAELQEALRLDPGDPSILQALAIYHFQKGNARDALPFARMLVDLTPNDPRARQLLQRIEMTSGGGR